MSKKDNELNVSREKIGQQWAEFLRERYNTRHAAKSVARDFGCEVVTAKAWLAGQCPQVSAFLRAAQLFGMSAAIGVLFPNTEIHHRSKLADDLADLRSRLDKLSKDFGGTSPHDHNTEDGSGSRR